MKAYRRDPSKTPRATEESRPLFGITNIIINLVAIAVFVGVYYYVIVNNYYPEYQDYLYWVVNVLVSYNILIASARSLWAPLLSISAGMFGIFVEGSTHALSFLTTAQCWQLAALGIAGLLINFTLRL